MDEVPAGYTDILHKNGVIRSSLVIISGSGRPHKCVRETWSMLDHSLTESLNNHYWKSINLILRYLLHLENEKQDTEEKNINEEAVTRQGIALHFLLLVRYFFIRFKYKVNKIFFYRKWFIRIAENNGKDELSLNQRFSPLRSSRDKF
jgi:hypothetical protein